MVAVPSLKKAAQPYVNVTQREKDPNNGVVGPEYYNMNGIWSLKPYYWGPWTLRVIGLNPKRYALTRHVQRQGFQTVVESLTGSRDDKDHGIGVCIGVSQKGGGSQKGT